MKFDINNNGTKVELKITFKNGWAGDYTWNFPHETNNKAYAGLAASELHDQFQKHIERIRRAAYNEGWEDKLKRRTKRTEFDWCPNIVKMERY